MLDARQIAEIVRARDQDPEVTPSTLHYYVQIGVLPPAVGRGRSGYTPEHLSRFRLARRLKREGLGLAEVRERLARLSPEQVAAELGSAETPGGPRQGAPALGGPARGGPAPDLYAAPAPAPHSLSEPGPSRRAAKRPAVSRPPQVGTTYAMAAEALRARRDAPRTLRFRGGFSLQVPAGTTDEQIARLYAAIEAALNQEENR